MNDNLELIDFDAKGNAVRLYFGKNGEQTGDDWDDRPYECNAGIVYEEYIKGIVDVFLPVDIDASEPATNCKNSNYSKNDFIHKKSWVLWIEKEWEGALNRKPVAVFFGDTLEQIKEKLHEYILYLCKWRVSMNYDIKTITKWEATPENGAPLLCMPNCPLPLHGLAPRTIMGEYQWGKVRKRINVEQNYTCQASGEELGKGRTHAHELYTIDWENHTSVFERVVCLDPLLHTTIIHSGRALTLFERGDQLMSLDKMLAGLEKGFKLISDWNRDHYNDEPLRVSSTILDWAKNPILESRVNQLIKKYKIKFYDFDKSCFNKHNWSKWKLIYDCSEYPTKFANQQEWEDYFKPEPVEKRVEKAPEELGILDSILKGDDNEQEGTA